MKREFDPDIEYEIYRQRQVDDEAEIERIVDEVTYRCYRHNRKARPDLSPQSWAKVLNPALVQVMEVRYQAEQRVPA